MHTYVDRPGAAAPVPERWDLWDDCAREPALNMALDVALLDDAAQRGRPLLRFYQWDRPAVSIGYHQNADSAPTDRYAVVRRPTGGGVVYHDHDFTYTVVVPQVHWLTRKDRNASYRYINDAVSAGLRQCGFTADLSDAEIRSGVNRRAMVCFEHPTRYDIVMNGHKIAGSAQRRTKQGMIHQGSIHFGAPLPVPRDVLANALRRGFEQHLRIAFELFVPDDALARRARQLVDAHFGQYTWNYRR